jgi:UBA/TS-N domain.
MQDSSTSEEKVALLISMGFAKSQAQQALDLCQGNIDMAVDRILSGQIDVANASSSFTRGEVEEVEGQGMTIVQAANGVNQYSFSDGGPSACTCIALHVASSALDYLNHCHDRIGDNDDHDHCTVQNNSNESASHNSSTNKYTLPEARNFFTAERLQSMLCRGVEMYNVLIKGQRNMGSSLGDTTTAQTQHHQDHLSPEQVLALLDSSSTTNTNTSAHAQWNVSLKLLKCGIRQGLLQSQYNMTSKPNQHTFQTAAEHVTDLKGILHDCHFVHQQEQEEEQVVNGNNDEEEWMCAIITKPPETVCVFLPPRKRVVLLQESLPYVLVDSHPRPGLGIESAYAKFHSSLESLVSTLTTDIFPFTHLGCDDEEQDWMTAMYNSFDVYPLRLRK